jgi:hypothetical protein
MCGKRIEASPQTEPIAEAAMWLTPAEQRELLAIKSHMQHARFLLRTSSHQWREARHLLHSVLENLNELEQKAASLRSALQKPNA